MQACREPARASGAINNTGPCAGVAAQGQEGASAPLKYYSAPPFESNFLRALLEVLAPVIPIALMPISVYRLLFTLFIILFHLL